MYAPRPEAQLSTCLHIAYHERWRWQLLRSGGIAHSIDPVYAGKVYHRVEQLSVCEDSHTEHVYSLQVQQSSQLLVISPT